MEGAGRNERTITGRNGARFPTDGKDAFAFEDEIKLFGFFVEVGFGGLFWGERSFRQALVLHRSIRAVEDATDLRAVFRDERFLAG